jgi:hypothetical protein
MFAMDYRLVQDKVNRLRAEAEEDRRRRMGESGRAQWVRAYRPVGKTRPAPHRREAKAPEPSLASV